MAMHSKQYMVDVHFWVNDSHFGLTAPQLKLALSISNTFRHQIIRIECFEIDKLFCNAYK